LQIGIECISTLLIKSVLGREVDESLVEPVVVEDGADIIFGKTVVRGIEARHRSTFISMI
jgi:hypothetical protein